MFMGSDSSADADTVNIENTSINTNSNDRSLFGVDNVSWQSTPLIDNGDRKHHVCGIYFGRVGCICGYFCIVSQLQFTSGSDNRECSRGNRHTAGPFCGTPIDFQRNGPGAGKAVITSDPVCSIRYGDCCHLNGSGIRIVYDPGVVCYDHRAIDNMDREKSGEGDIDGTILVCDGQRDRNGCRSRACGCSKSSRAGRERKHDGLGEGRISFFGS